VALTMSPTLHTALGLCLGIRGKIGALCTRKTAGVGMIVYRERRRTAPLTEKQIAHQTKFKRAYEQWATLSAAQQNDWNRAADVTSSRTIGSHLFLRVWWYQDTWTLEQIQRWYQINLVLPGA